jgi:hypothetical protein
VAGGALLDCLELLHSASGGAVDAYSEPLIGEMGRYIHRMHISEDWFANFADCNAKVQIPAGLVHRYGSRIADPQLSALGSWVYSRRGVEALLGGKLLRVLQDLFHAGAIDGDARPPLVRDVWLDGIQVMAARECDGSDRGLYLAAKGGFNNESHNHNDVGHFIVYHDGEPALVDPGVGTYTAKTFGEHRYELWTMQSAYHNLPTVNGVQQRDGDEFSARDVQYCVEEAAAEMQLDIAGAYPGEAGIESWRRTCRLVRGENACVEITDEFALKAPTRDIMLSFMTPCEPDVSSPGVIALPVSGGSVRLTYDAGTLAASVERIDFDDERLGLSWGDHLFRILLRAREEMDLGAFVTRIEGP